MKTSNVQLTLLVLVAAAAVVTALGQTISGNGDDNTKIVGTVNANNQDEGAASEIEPLTLVIHREKRGYNPGSNADYNPGYNTGINPGYNPGGYIPGGSISGGYIPGGSISGGYIPGGSISGGCPPCPPCVGPGIGSVRKS